MKWFPFVLALLLMVSCASPPPRVDVDNVPLPPPKYEDRAQYVTASWYGKKFHGRPTASGERYDMYGLTAAHKTMKFGTKLRVTNPENNKSVIVVVNDRGPFIRGRDLDLSYGAAKAIGHVEKGVGTVKIEHLGRDMKYVKRQPYMPSSTGGKTLQQADGLTIQVGAFREKANAERLKQGLELTYPDVYITTATVKGSLYYRVRVGSYKVYDSAFATAEKLADEGYTTFITVPDL